MCSHINWCLNKRWADSHIPCVLMLLSDMGMFRYNPFIHELTEARFRARRLLSKYNSTPIPDETAPDELRADREAILDQLLGSVGSNIHLEPPIFVDYGCNISVGNNFYANFHTTMLDCSLIIIGDRVSFGPNVSILGATHETSVQSRRDGLEFAREVLIANDCWIGGGVTILAGITIGEGCTIGAGAIVTKNIPPFSVAVGIPARVVKIVEPAAAIST
ncbi:hypothetical protein N7522_004227 [Penicillium canescens]|uniref:Maltose/galactoside acetyltransferase domain-containing protein n=1 Tax=Penicillium canescens TaxID=5083 RepID=A0AAD6N3L4_PENCN|nr:uncharacterized protein N7446_004121 [Penicillium canescens]KAJ6009211.1 hypothetical protein N7522_004227 [Penicillium canescens]KAJ6027280.1 hypothetical protein N7460_012097 [Penicillium canescens]KAJ6040563.1 hypothetical protein N7444_009468 [Penicillium canescens]KAJ6067084.1 hypothetical protein N7446_004121 [Penicillium canescens]